VWDSRTIIEPRRKRHQVICQQKARKDRRAKKKQVSTKKPINIANPVDYDLSGYMPKRNEFECEWDDECEKKIMDIEFYQQDTREEVEAKLKALEEYNVRLAKRHAMRRLVVDKRLHDAEFQKAISSARSCREEKMHSKFKKYIQLLSPEEYEEFIKGLALQQELEEKVNTLQEYRTAGLKTMEEVQEYEKSKKELSRSSSSSSTSWSSSPPPSPPSTPQFPSHFEPQISRVLRYTEEYKTHPKLPLQGRLRVSQSQLEAGYKRGGKECRQRSKRSGHSNINNSELLHSDTGRMMLLIS